MPCRHCGIWQRASTDGCGVLTQPDRPKGRGHHTIPTAVKAAALEYDIPVYQPLSLRKGEDAAAALETLRQLNPDLIVVLAYGQILPKEVLELPKYGCINLHASLLPAYRGAAPIQWVILNGETKTGVTAQQMGEGLDTGDMLVKKETAIGPEETAEELYSRLSELCVETLEETLAQLEAGTLHGTPQDDAQSSYASRITKEMSALDFTRPAAELHNLIRGINRVHPSWRARPLVKVLNGLPAGSVRTGGLRRCRNHCRSGGVCGCLRRRKRTAFYGDPAGRQAPDADGRFSAWKELEKVKTGITRESEGILCCFMADGLTLDMVWY